MRPVVLGISTLVLAAQSLSALADGTHFAIPANNVIPVTFREDLSLKDNRPGDGFTTTVKDDRDFPAGTRIEGRIIDIEPKTKNHNAYMDLEFLRVVLPDGTTAPIHAIPIPLNDKSVRKTADGRYESQPAMRKDNMVLGGALGGLIFGSLIKKPFEGTFVGTLIGIVAAETAGDSDVVIKKGQDVGALIQQDFAMDSSRSYAPGANSANDDRDLVDKYANRRVDGRSDDRGDARPTLSFKDEELRFPADEQPYRAGETVMVPLQRLADQMNLTVEKLGSGVYLLESDDRMMRLELDSNVYRLNGKRGTFAQSPVVKKDVAYVPIEAFAKMKVGRMSVDGTNVDSES